MKSILQSLPYPLLIAIALLLGLAPFSPQPHLVEKVVMLVNGELKKAIDIFDLLFHLAPSLLLGIKVVYTINDKKNQKP